MEVEREGTKAGNTENIEFTEETAVEPLSFSSNRFVFSGFEDNDNVGSIDNVNQLFIVLKKKPPSLEKALECMGYKNSKELYEKFLTNGKEKLEEIDAPGLTAEDLAVVQCYTYEWEEKLFGKGESPYRKLNNSLSVERNNKALRDVCSFMFLLLRVLRKLPRYIPEKRALYRGIKIHVQTEYNNDFPSRKPYSIGNEKTWWPFTSTTTDLEVVQMFIGEDDGTIFVLNGETWGYYISVLSDFPEEKEVLLEPERKLSITGVVKRDNIITVNASILNTPLILKDIIVAGQTVKIKMKKIKIKYIPENLRSGNLTENTVELAWDKVQTKKKKIVEYQVSVKKVSSGFFSRNVESVFKTTEEKYTVGNLEKGTEYEFRVRCGFDNEWGNWSEMIKVAPFAWEDCSCPSYSIDIKNPRVVTKTENDDVCCTIIGNTCIPLNKVASWSIKVLKSKEGNGDGIYIGVSPLDMERGWYFNCYYSSICSDPLHDNYDREYGPRKRKWTICTHRRPCWCCDGYSKGRALICPK